MTLPASHRSTPGLTRRAVALCAAFAAVARPSVAQVLKKTVHLVVGFPPGGATDLIARMLAERLRGSYAPSVIVENKPGAAARVAVDYVKNAEPDGSEVLFTPDFPLTVYPHSFRTLSYDPLRDLVPVAPVSRSPLTFVIGPAVPRSVGTLAEFVAWCRANPERAIFATTSAGGTPHFVGVMLANEAHVALTPVHYRGGAPALQDLVGAHVPASVNPIAETLPFAASGKVRVLAVTSPERSKFLPGVPTMREAGYDIATDSWLGVFAPARTPSPIVRALNAAIAEAVNEPQMIDGLARIGSEPKYQPSDAFAATVRADMERWRPVVKASGFVAEE
jgi:tripartite-type tricarboxylate transporter receptor subunit TctC